MYTSVRTCYHVVAIQLYMHYNKSQHNKLRTSVQLCSNNFHILTHTFFMFSSYMNFVFKSKFCNKSYSFLNINQLDVLNFIISCLYVF